MNQKIKLMLLVFILLEIGCTTAIKYDLTDLAVTQPSPSRQSLKVAILPFEDLRPDTEKNSVSSYSKIIVNDKMIEGGNVSKSISETLAAHFNHVKLFQSVDVFNEAGSNPNEIISNRLQELEYSAVFTGKVKHFYGAAYTTTLDKVAPILAFLIPVSAIITIPIALSEENTHDTHVEIIDVQLRETRTRKVIWSGSYIKKPERKYADTYPVRAASDTLKDIAVEIVAEIEKINFGHITKNYR